jgi:hypothetical protein
MEAKSALELIEQVCEEIQEKRKAKSRLAALMEKARPLGLALTIGLAGAGCGDDSLDKIPGPDSAYGIPDSYLMADAGPDMITGPDSAYGIPDSITPKDDAGADMITGPDSAYGIPDSR